jgi:hypothetical protein
MFLLFPISANQQATEANETTPTLTDEPPDDQSLPDLMEVRTTAGKVELLPLVVKTEETHGKVVTTMVLPDSREATGRTTTMTVELKRTSEAGMLLIQFRSSIGDSFGLCLQRGF